MNLPAFGDTWLGRWGVSWGSSWTNATSVQYHSPAEIIQQLLFDMGIATNPDEATPTESNWPAYSTGGTDGPDNAISVTDTTGAYNGRAMKGGKAFFHYGIQIILRATNQRVGWLKINELLEQLTRGVVRAEVKLDGVNYLVQCVARPGQIIPLPNDGSGSRNLFSLNFTTPIRRL